MLYKFLLYSLILSIIVVFPAFSHELIIKSLNSNAKKGEIVAVDVYSTHFFLIPEELENPDNIKLTLVQNGVSTDLKLKANEKRAMIESSYTLKSEQSAIILGHRVPEIWSNTTKGVQQGDVFSLQKKGFTVVDSTKYEKFSKTFINSSIGDDSYSKSFNQLLEITPITNPADMKKGEYAEFIVTYDKKPISLPIWATYDGFSDQSMTFAYYTESDEQGRFKVKITSDGTWLVRTMLKKAGNKTDKQNLEIKSVVTFDVK